MIKYLRNTVIAGVLFLIPIIVLVIIGAKFYEFLVLLATPMDKLIPLDSIGGIAVANILVVLLLLVICFLAGILSTGKIMKKTQKGIENKILVKLPGYPILKGFMDSMSTTKKASENFIPVLVAFDDSEQLCFEIEETTNNKVVVYVPGAPNPWSGAVLYMDKSRVKRLKVNISEAIENIQGLGLGTENLIK
ncbi:DUF502 domain-containing protein [Algibacter mikhailovii]|uniref:DUF502 domain-containing protein n=1 Tax=Algibacter mikhailovii TaxID=425498 RepID=A0A918QTM3_9FLAO|nr:DUF502 domain-containing protein [Algibacter mikhailovii]GGZ69800.1 hypothetical protein GCM10007028_03610 [Algibacter mikhailovii]